jgi:hypothetical protein
MATGSWKMFDLPADFREAWRQGNAGVELPKGYQTPSGLTALVGREPFGNTDDDIRWHISVRYGDPGVDGRVPSWEEMVNAAHELRPGVVFVIGVPPRSWWMSVHPHVLHLHETRDAALIAEFQANAMSHAPS